MTAFQRLDDVAPRRPTSPRLGNFSQIYNACLGLPSEDEGNKTKSEAVATEADPSVVCGSPVTPPPSHPTLALYTSGLLGGLVLDSDGAISSPECTSDDETSTLKPSVSTADSCSTPELSTPSSSEGEDKSHSTAITERHDYFPLPLLSSSGTVVSSIELSANLPFHFLGGGRFYEFNPLPGFDSDRLRPRYISDRASKLALLHVRLHDQFNRDAAKRMAFGPIAASPIHVFVDLSNIIIGFYDRLKLDRGVPLTKQVRPPPFFFEGFRRVLERGRPVARRVLAGSTYYGIDRSKWPAYMREAEQCGFEMNILSRVAKISPKTFYNRGHRSTNGWTTSDQYSSDEATTSNQMKLGEQAVDEILHLKMCHSFLDHEPSTIVLATGDAAQAEFSDGFLKHVERALARGWCVELLAWRKNISAAWRALERNPLWTGHFQLIELDPLVDELFGVFLKNIGRKIQGFDAERH